MEEELYKTMATVQAAAIDEVLKKLIALTGIDPETVNARNISETQQVMKDRGYRLEQVYDGDKTNYELRHNHKIVCIARVWTEYSEKDGEFKAVMKHQLFPGSYDEVGVPPTE